MTQFPRFLTLSAAAQRSAGKVPGGALRIGLLVCEGFRALELSALMGAFFACRSDSGVAYEVTVLSPQGGLLASAETLRIMTTRLDADPVLQDTLIVLGGHAGASAPVSPGLAILATAARRLIAIGDGQVMIAAILAAGGHAVSETTSERTIRVAADARAATALAIEMIAEDFGDAFASTVAANLDRTTPRGAASAAYSPRIRNVLAYVQEHLGEPLLVEHLAEIACLSPRQFVRICYHETTLTPARLIERMRVETARTLIENGTEAIEQIALTVGFEDPERMRRAFLRRFARSPQALRRQARHHRA